MVIAASLADGCAITPSGVNNASTKQIICTMDVAGVINPNDFYFVVFNNANDTSGRGGAGSADCAGLGRQRLCNWKRNIVYGVSARTIQFRLCFSAISTRLPRVTCKRCHRLSSRFRSKLWWVARRMSFSSVFRSPTWQRLLSQQAQLLLFRSTLSTPTKRPLVAITSPKLFDALGNTLNSATLNEPITIPTQQDGTYSNSTFAGMSNEPSSQDVASTLGTGTPTATSDPDAPNLDITNWSVQITS